MTVPRVSFILPAYKQRYLREAIASILGQSYTDFELVVVDDCSPEDLKSVVEEFHDNRLSYYRNAENLGRQNLVSAWHRAMEYAKGEWCILASDDDVYLPRCLEELVGLTEKYPKCDLFHARTAEIDAGGRWTSVAYPRREFESQVEFTYARAVRRMEQHAPDFMFRRTAWISVGGFVNFPLGTYSDDATWMMLAKNGCVHTSEVGFCFRMSGINLSSTHDDIAPTKITECQDYVRWFSDFAKGLKPVGETERYMCANLLECNAVRVRELQWWVINQVHDWTIKKKAMRLMGCSAWEIRQSWYERHPRIRAIVTLLPHFSRLRNMLRCFIKWVMSKIVG